MKAFILSLTIGLMILSFTQCKKGSAGNPPPVDSSARLPEGRYILRTAYVKCGADSIAFALGMYSNFEVLGFNAVRKQDIANQDENFIWNVQPVYQIVVFKPGNKPEDYGLLGYRIYKIFPDGTSYYFLGMTRPPINDNSQVDNVGRFQELHRVPINELPRNTVGLGEPYINPPGYTEDNHPGHFDEYSGIIGLDKTVSGNYKLRNNRYEHVFHNWKSLWSLTTTNNWADGVCDHAQLARWRPIGSYGCGNVNEDGDIFRRCYIDEFYFEKVD